MCFRFDSKNSRLNRDKNDKEESMKLQRTPSNNSGLRIVGSGTNLSLMGEPFMGIDPENSPTKSSSKINNTEQRQSSISVAGGGGSLRSFPVQRETASMTDINDVMYLQQRKCETCSSSLVGPNLRKSNW